MTCKILHIVPSLNRGSGIAKVLYDYYKLIDKNKIQFDFMYLNNAPINYIEDIESIGGKCFYVHNIKEYSKFKKDLKAFCVEHNNEYSIIHLHIPFLAPFFSSLKKEINAKSFVLHAHSTKFGDTNFTNIRNRIFYRIFGRKADYYFACSKAAGEKIFKNSYIENGFFMNNIIDIELIDKKVPKDIAKEKLKIDSNFVVGHVGIFHEPKNHFFIIDVFSEILKIKPDAKLLLIGDGYLRESVEKYAMSKDVYNQTIFTGFQSEVDQYYSAMDVFLFPSLFEGFAIALAEAQSFNLPCVVSDIIVSEAVINGRNLEYLSLNKDAKTWAKTVVDFYNQHIDYSNSNSDIVKANILNSVKQLENKYISMIK